MTMGPGDVGAGCGREAASDAQTIAAAATASREEDVVLI
jgi:hypothetical protein